MDAIRTKVLSGFELRLSEFFFFAFVVFYPFYLFPPGGLQPFLFFLLLSIVWGLKVSDVKKLSENRLLVFLGIFVGYSFFVNFFYSLSYVSASPLKYSVYYAIIFLLCFVFLNSFSAKSSMLRGLYFSLILSLALQFVLSFVFIPEKLGARFVILFNNPNQLAYFAILVLMLITSLKLKYKIEERFFYLGVFLCLYLVILSLSKAVFLGAVFFLLAWTAVSIKVNRYRDVFRIAVVAFLAVLVASSVFKVSNCQASGLDLASCIHSNELGFGFVESRINSIGKDVDDNLKARGYSRILESYQYLFFGAGEGIFDRFETGGELHSTFGSLLFCYGIIGAVFGIWIVYRAFVVNGVYTFLYLGPLVVYSLSHNGLRSPFLWLLIILLITRSDHIVDKNSDGTR